jgi:hypothetical protein
MKLLVEEGREGRREEANRQNSRTILLIFQIQTKAMGGRN